MFLLHLGYFLLVAVVFDFLLPLKIFIFSHFLHNFFLVIGVQILDFCLIFILHMLYIFSEFLLELSLLF